MVISPPWRKLVAVAGLAVALGLAGCSSGASGNDVASLNGGKTSTSAPASGSGSGDAKSDASEQDAMVKFAQCMRQHGIDMPDPKPAPGGSGGAMVMPAMKAGGGPDQLQKIQAASTACDKLLPNGGKPTAQDTQRELKFAQCMRAHGVDIPDPDPNGGGGKGMTIDGRDPKTKAALSACGSGLGISDAAGSTSGK